MPSRESKEPEDYLIEITDFQFEYMFSLAHTKYEIGPYTEYCQPKILGKLLYPQIKDVTDVEVYLVADRSLDESLSQVVNARRFEPIAVGGIEKQGEVLEVRLSTPFAAMALLASVLENKRQRYLSLHGKKLKYRKAKVQMYNFSNEYDQEDYI